MKFLYFILILFSYSNLVGQSVEKFNLTPENKKLEGQFYIGNFNSASPEEAKFKFLKWLAYYNAGEDIYIDEISENRVVFTRIFPQGINMRILKGIEYDMLGNVDLAVRFVVEFKNSRYRLLIDRLAYFESEFDSPSFLTATGKFKEYTLYFTVKDISRLNTSYNNPLNLPLEYRNPGEIKGTEKKKLDDLIILLNSFLNNSKDFENEIFPDIKIVNDSFKITENNSFPGQAIRKQVETINQQDIIENTRNWFETNREELGLQKFYFFEDKILLVGKRYFNSSSGFLSTVEALTGTSFGELQYYFIEIKLNDDSIDFGVNKILRASFTRECGTGLDKVRIEAGGYEFIVDKKIYIPTSENSAAFGGLKEFDVCPAILMFDEVTFYSDLFNKKGKPRKAKTIASEDELAFYNSIYQNYNRNVFNNNFQKNDDW